MIQIKDSLRRVAIIAGSEKTANVIAIQLNEILGKFITFIGFSMHEWRENKNEFHMVLISTQTIFTRDIAPRIKTGTIIFVIRRTLLRKSWEKVMAIPSGSKLLVVNDQRDSSEETISLLRELGAGHLELFPYYPGVPNWQETTAAITPGERQLVPAFINQVIDINERVVDVSTLVDILTQFQLLNNETRNVLSRYADKIVTRSQGIQFTLQGMLHINNILQRTLNMVQDGVIAYDHDGIITLFNRTAETIFGFSSEEAQKHTVEGLLHREGVDPITLQQEWKDCLIHIKKQKILINRQHIDENGLVTGGVLTLKIGKKVEELELKLRMQSKGHEAKYSFSDLITSSEKMIKVVSRAEKMAKSDLSVLILGESGTGKELFAHAIHQASHRASFPFVAVNCSALPDNLLESELFGYEEGAFTGAKKGGKPGLFEQAHKGTIFLDEIGDISPNMQSRLLRVLQQKEVLKVGGTRLLHVDVRIIAATNRHLAKLVEEGKFRDDLYYRLKILQLEVPPLRERREDIPLLASYFLERRGAIEVGLDGIYEALQYYRWPGNVRELENTMEYIAFMNDGNLTIEDLPMYSDEQVDQNPIPLDTKDQIVSVSAAGISVEKLVLNIIHQSKAEGKNAGRRAIVTSAKEKGLAISENEVRKTVEKLRVAGYVEVASGRSGCKLTPQGYQKIQNGTI
ncbi:sigma-54 interaction domain-containing protein [Brevibacillus daliensis]|uniref:sigma-54 interaction domain-containing protein n=1 Tax=Brevibacillus daliensis TaxID=2892995 RepID=UPI001E52ECD2|nr:sigma 54-interacting transcriptional regulator [Brevibacillus daliensis]